MKQFPQLNLAIHEDNTRKKNEHGRPWLALLVLVGLAGVAIWFWLARDPEARQKLDQGLTEVSKMSESLNDIKSKILGNPPPPIATNSTAIPGGPPVGLTATAPATNLGAASDSNQASAMTGPFTMDQNSLPVTPAEQATTSTLVPPLDTENKTTDLLTAQTNLKNQKNQTVQTGQGNGTRIMSIPGRSDRTIPAQSSASGEILEDDPIMPLLGGASTRGNLGSTPPEDAGRQDDAVVRLDFIDDLAAWLIKGYVPGKGNQPGHLSISLQSANLRYGADMRGLAWLGEDLPSGRLAALKYVYTPSMLQALYRLYNQRFMQAMNQASQGLSLDQKKHMLQLYAQKMQGISGAMQSAAEMPNFMAKTDALKAASSNIVKTNVTYSELVFSLDQARETNNQAQIQNLQEKIQQASDTYRNAIIHRDDLKKDFTRALKQNPKARLLDDDTLFFVSNWVERRIRSSMQGKDASLQSSKIFDALSRNLEEASTKLQR